MCQHGEDAGSKLTKAQSLGVQVITETQFEEMIGKKKQSERKRRNNGNI